jgi:glycosyltransferase involved in cell wall biosynthesis
MPGKGVSIGEPLTAPYPSAAHRGQHAPRVIFINRYFFPDHSATSQMLTDLVRSLADSGLELHVVCSRQLYDAAGAQLPARQQAHGAQIHRVWTTRFGRTRLIGRSLDYLSFFVLATLATMLWTRRGDVIVAMTDPPLVSVCAAAVARMRGATLINWLQDLFPEILTALGPDAPRSRLIRILGASRTWSLHAARKNIVLGYRMRKVVCALGVPDDKQQIIENWADGDALAPRAATGTALRRSLDADDAFIVQYSGNLGRAHEFQTLLDAAQELREHAGWLFLLVGGGVNMDRLRQRARELMLPNMRFLPYRPREELGDSLGAADVQVISLLPQLEGLVVPSKFYSILAAARPVVVIGDPDGEQARIVRGADCGVVISCGNSRTLVDELRRMRADKEWLEAAGRRARALFERYYTIESATRKWRRVLQESVCPYPH